MSGTRRWRALTGATAVLGAMFVPATAHAADLAIPIDTAIESGIAAGDEAQLVEVVAGPLAGRNCLVSAVHGDAAPANPGNDLVVSSGDSTATLVDVESEPGAVTAGSSITVGNTITISLVMGPSLKFAGALVVELDCASQGSPDLPVTGGETIVALLGGMLFMTSGATLVRASRRTRPA